MPTEWYHLDGFVVSGACHICKMPASSVWTTKLRSLNSAKWSTVSMAADGYGTVWSFTLEVRRKVARTHALAKISMRLKRRSARLKASSGSAMTSRRGRPSA